MLENFRDYNLYLFKIKRGEIIILLIDLILFSISTYTLITNWRDLFSLDSNEKGVLLVLIGTIIKFIYDSYNIINEIKSSMDLRYGYIKSDIQEDIYNRLKIEDSNNYGYKIEEFKLFNGNIERVSRSRKVDEYLRNNSYALHKSKEMEKRIREFIKENKDDLLPFLKFNYRLSNFYGKMFFNEKKLCMSTDIKINNDKNIIYCHRGTYYDTYLTNIISGKELRSNDNNKLIASAEEYMPVIKKNNEYFLKNITSSVMNNEIGVSTLAITSDNYLVIWTQNRIAQSSGGLLVPTGSGSCDWSDIVGDSFNDTIINSMNRELWEENGRKNLCPSHKEIGKTKILGTFRWIKKGGKSEFVGLTKVNKDLISFSQEKREVFDRREFLIDSIDGLKGVVNGLLELDTISVPLYVNLKALKEYMDSNKEELEEFLNLKS
ncbi:hypothetical protein PMY56_06185 [Clostridium tertium]|jgi:hypothetical protein|uniref:hypothetical protein n=3 Tax=Clostridiaceae TaxID=31979 RepID=UPI00115A9247|nr:MULTISPECIES: hypothetical protein [Clostridium]MBS5305563.1 hypothetical protein [Clostridium sp.]MDB1922659.1 hypothetical protein [Clostridium tertium]MDB1925724.1 hypothetical protein [Clostridium tertium]MDB1929015.1 hypothetical protein [Clostridium tertium]MDB1943309.1 hypothetical protein [Clostridium tertium]